MERFYNYSVLRVIPDARRGESVNIGIVVFAGTGLDVRILPSLSKVAALNGQVDLAMLRQLPEALNEWTSGVVDAGAAHALLRDLGIVSVSTLGRFETTSEGSYERAVSRLMRTLVNPVTVPRQPYGTRLKTALRTKFKKSKLLGDTSSAIAEHLVVEDYPIDETEGLYADFALKNSAYHITETADFRAASTPQVGLLRAASLAAIKLDKAKQSFGNSTKRYVVYAARRGAPSQPVNLLGDYSDHIFHMDSRQDMASYFEIIATAASRTRSTAT
jgi:hypothetical protein